MLQDTSVDVQFEVGLDELDELANGRISLVHVRGTSAASKDGELITLASSLAGFALYHQLHLSQVETFKVYVESTLCIVPPGLCASLQSCLRRWQLWMVCILTRFTAGL